MKFSPRLYSQFLHKFINRNLLVCHCLLPASSAKFATDGQIPEAFCASLSYTELFKKIQQCREEWRRHKQGSPEYDRVKQQILKLQEEILQVEKLKFQVNKEEMSNLNISNLVLAPTHITLEVISNGTTHLRPSVLIRTPAHSYLFNCPEGMSRFLSTHRLRSVTVNDFFITKANWENTGGIASVLLDKVNASGNVRLHGPPRIKNFLEQQRPFLDVDFGHVNYPVGCEECSYEREHFEDAVLRVRYIPLAGDHRRQKQSSSSSSSPSPPNSPLDTETNGRIDIRDKGNRVHVAYLVQVKDAPPNIDPMKLLKLKIPKGPHIAKLKAGIPVILEDGREIQPSDVYSEVAKLQMPNLLFVELVSGDKLGRIHANAALKEFMGEGRTQQMNYVVHFTRQRLVDSADYRVWMRAFGPECRHLVVNGTGPPMTLNEGIYKAQQQLNAIFPQGFPQIYPPPEHYEGKLFTQNFECDDSLAQHPPTADGIGPIFLGSLFLRFPIRGHFPKFPSDDANMLKLDFTVNELDFRTESLPELPKKLEKFRKTLDAALAARAVSDPYPQVFFLGTASAVPAKYRNVSSYLLQLSPTSAVMVDCGEGTYGQMRTLFGPEHCVKMLTNLNALFITHSHLDHTNGLFTIVQERIRAFSELGVPYRPLLFVSNYTVRKIINTAFTHCYHNIDRFLKYVDIPFLNQKDSVGIHPKAVSFVPSPGAVIEFTKHFPRPLFSAEQWNLRSAKGVQVLHTRASHAFVFESEDSRRRVVFSGDTKPCQLLEEQGRDADLLIHECTFEDGMENDAFRKRHSTMRQAFDSARRMRAKQVVLTHFSTRYSRVPPLPDYLVEAGNFAVANDYMVVPFDLRHVFPKLLPVYRALFKEELFVNQIKTMKRRLEQQQDEAEQQKQQQILRS